MASFENSSNGVPIIIGPNTKYVISTSGRMNSLKRYQILLQRLLKLDIAYIPFHNNNKTITPESFVATLKSMPCIGGAISKDIKHGVVPLLDELDEVSEALQSVNTVIVQKDGKLKGYNTDALGFRHAIETGMKESNITVRTAICYGSGGVASVVVGVLKTMGISVYLAGRTPATVEKRASELGISVWTPQVGAVDLVVNATPASEQPLDNSPSLVTCLQGCKLVFDHEMPGKYLKEYCESNGIYHIAGVVMYYPQMAVQWSLFLQDYTDTEKMEELLKTADDLVSST